MLHFPTLLLAGLISISSMVLTAQSAQAKGVGSSGGGDLQAIFPELKLKPQIDPVRKQEIIALFNDDRLRVRLYRWFEGNRMYFREQAQVGLSPEAIEKEMPYCNSPGDAFLHDKPWLTQALTTDIEEAEYVLTDQPFEIQGHEKDAFTYHSLRTMVIFNLNRLARYDLPLEELKQKIQALLYHEHLRHVEIRDEDYALGKLAMDRAHEIEILFGDTKDPEKLHHSTLGFAEMKAVARALSVDLGTEGILCRFPDGPLAGQEVACPELYDYDFHGALSILPREAQRKLFDRINAEMRAAGFHQRVSIYSRSGEFESTFAGMWIADQDPGLEKRAWQTFQYRINFKSDYKEMQLSIFGNRFGHYIYHQFCRGDSLLTARSPIPRCSVYDPLSDKAREIAKTGKFISD